jgi:hypothetical protein
VAHIWAWFCEVSDGRPDGFSGPGALGYPDVMAWTVVCGVLPTPTEVRLILITDREWRGEYNRLQELKRPKPNTQPSRKR